MIFRANPPTLSDLDGLLGKKPGDYDATVAALALDASSLIASLEPWWVRGCNYRWGSVDVLGCGPNHPWQFSCSIGVADPEVVGQSRQLWRASVPASIYAALAVVKSGGKLDYVGGGDVPTGGLFALPLSTARAAGFNPWSVYDALRFVRVGIEGRVAGWQSRQGPAPACRELRDFVYASLFQELVGSAAATYVFGLLDNKGVTPDNVCDILRYGQVPVTAAFSGITKEDVTALAYAARDILDASELVEGFDYASRIGVFVGQSGVQDGGVLRSVPRESGWISPFPAAAVSDPAGAAAGAVVTDLVPGGVIAQPDTLELPPRLYPWEVPDYDGGSPFDQILGDGWQMFSFYDFGHYPTRHAILSTLVPTYIEAVRQGEAPTPYPRPALPEREPPPPRRETAELGTSWGKYIAIGAAVLATATAAGAAWWWWQRRRRGGLGRPRWHRLTTSP